jgi:hypothetical protein
MIFDGVLVIGRFLRFEDARIHGYPSHARCSLDWRAWTLPKQHLLLYYGQSTEMRERERERRERARERESERTEAVRMEGGREDKRNARRLRADLDRCLQAPSTRSPHHASSTLLMLFLSSSFSFSFLFFLIFFIWLNFVFFFSLHI